MGQAMVFTATSDLCAGQQPRLLPWGLTGERSVWFTQGLREQQLRKLASGRGVHQPQPSLPGSSGFLLRRDVSAFSVRCKRNWTWLGFLPDRAEAAPEEPAGLCSGDLEGALPAPRAGGAP